MDVQQHLGCHLNSAYCYLVQAEKAALIWYNTIQLMIRHKMFQHGVPPYLSGFVCAFHPAAPGSSPKHSIFTLISLLNCIIWKRKNREKEDGIGPYFQKTIQLTDSDVSLPRERSEAGLVAADNATLRDVAVVRAQAASGVVLDGAVVDLWLLVHLLFKFQQDLLVFEIW